MKKFLILVFAILLAVPILTSCNMRINYYENKLYSEKDINNNVKVGNIQDNNTLTREKAIAKALDIFDKGFNIKLNREELDESIRIIRRSEKDILYWDITWTSISTKKMYNCAIDTSSGKIKDISLYNSNEEEERKENAILNEKDILSAVDPLFKALKIDPNNYYIKNANEFYVYTAQNQIFNFKNKVNDKEDITIMVNCNNKTITGFSINTYENGDYDSQSITIGGR
ncbi:hypothetical protein CF095_03015 [Clostridium botulinum]|uniref:hypothetical protein n=1 Tax=Clostridium botulinum TaxID=1491 RepID=UPI000772E332|nr:hypothetical protein [Clostridium botulinum]MCJ8171123.1 hypothetical protein [Clostridium botulinum]